MIYNNNVKLSIYGLICLLISLTVPFYIIYKCPYVVFNTHLLLPLLFIFVYLFILLINYISIYFYPSNKNFSIFKHDIFYLLAHKELSFILTIIPIIFLSCSILFKFYLEMDYTSLFIIPGVLSLSYYFISHV